tara:strand:- start:66 stop:269 length:204 start_codon:yes stop_codon:yes gene_type:complete
MPLLSLSFKDMEFSHLFDLSHQIREIFNEGCGFCIVNKLPIENMSEYQAITIYWLLAQLLGRTVAQK